MLNRSRIESEATTQNIVPDDPYPVQEGDNPRYEKIMTG
jgi:hypothetical protein